MKYALIIAISLSVCGALSAQGVTVNEEPAVTRLMNNYVQHNQLHQKVRGWRVQVLVTTDRRQMESTRDEFGELFPDRVLHYKHDNPFYHLKTGAFLTQAAARPYLKEIKEVYKSAFIVADEVDVSEVIEYL